LAHNSHLIKKKVDLVKRLNSKHHGERNAGVEVETYDSGDEE